MNINRIYRNGILVTNRRNLQIPAASPALPMQESTVSPVFPVLFCQLIMNLWHTHVFICDTHITVSIHHQGWKVEKTSFISGVRSVNEQTLKFYKVPDTNIESIYSKLTMRIFDEYTNILNLNRLCARSRLSTVLHKTVFKRILIATCTPTHQGVHVWMFYLITTTTHIVNACIVLDSTPRRPDRWGPTG